MDEKETQLVKVVQELKDNKMALLNVLEDLQAEKEKLEEEKATDSAILSSVGEGLFVTDEEGKILIANKAFEAALGFSSQEVIGKDISDVVVMQNEGGDIVSKEKRPTSQLLSGMRIKKMQTAHLKGFYYVRKDKSRFPVAITVSPVVNSRVLGSITVFRDITEEFRIDRAKSELISIASHQLRTPLAALSWLIELLKDSFKEANLTEKQISYLKDVAISISRMTSLMEDLLNVSRIQLETVQIQKKPVDIVEFINKFIKDNEDYASSKNHTIVFEKVKKKLALIELDPRILYNIMQNLVSNAIDYSPSGTVVTITLKIDEQFIKFSVSNQGSSIPKEDRDHLFEKFYRGEDARKVKTNGTGLGLFIVKSFVEKMGGQIGFSSADGEETVFWFTLPIFL